MLVVLSLSLPNLGGFTRWVAKPPSPEVKTMQVMECPALVAIRRGKRCNHKLICFLCPTIYIYISFTTINHIYIYYMYIYAFISIYYMIYVWNIIFFIQLFPYTKLPEKTIVCVKLL